MQPREPQRFASRAARPLSLALIATALTWAGAAAPVEAASPSCLKRTNNTYSKLLECVTVEGVRAHQAKFQAIGDANDDEYYPGSRVAGTKGYADSVDYVAGKLRGAGYDVTLDPFQFQFVFPSLLRQLTRTAADYDRDLHRLRQRRHHRQRHPRRHQPHATTGEHERLRSGRLRRPRLLPVMRTSP